MQTALLVEDHVDTLRWMSDLLRDAFAGIDVTEASTLSEAREHIKRTHFNLALIDINLPDGSGIDLIREITRQHPESYCVVATIFDDEEILLAALKAGAQGYLLKEQPKEQLLKRLQGILAGDPPLSPAIARQILHHFHEVAESPPDVKLSPREKEVLTLIAKGYTRTEIADLLAISSHTAAGYIKAVYQKLNVSSRAEATLEAARLGFVRTDDK